MRRKLWGLLATLVAIPVPGEDLHPDQTDPDFARTADVAIGLNPPDWQAYWGMLTYALLLPNDQSSLPAS